MRKALESMATSSCTTNHSTSPVRMAVISALAGPVIGYVLWSAWRSVELAYTKRDPAEFLEFPVLLLASFIGLIFAYGTGALPAALTGAALSLVRRRGATPIAAALAGLGVGGLTQTAFLFVAWRNDLADPMIRGELATDAVVGAASGAILGVWLPSLDQLARRCLDPPSTSRLAVRSAGATPERADEPMDRLMRPRS